MNLIKDLQIHIEKLRPDLECEPREENGFLILVIKNSVLSDVDQYIQVFRKVKDSPFRQLFSLYTKKNQFNQILEAGFKLRLEDVYVSQLRDFFNKDISQEEIDKCIAYLSEHGWDQKRFQIELGFSKSTSWRLVNKTKSALNSLLAPQAEPSAVSMSNLA